MAGVRERDVHSRADVILAAQRLRIDRHTRRGRSGNEGKVGRLAIDC